MLNYSRKAGYKLLPAMADLCENSAMSTVGTSLKNKLYTLKQRVTAKLHLTQQYGLGELEHYEVVPDGNVDKTCNDWCQPKSQLVRNLASMPMVHHPCSNLYIWSRKNFSTELICCKARHIIVFHDHGRQTSSSNSHREVAQMVH